MSVLQRVERIDQALGRPRDVLRPAAARSSALLVIDLHPHPHPERPRVRLPLLRGRDTPHADPQAWRRARDRARFTPAALRCTVRTDTPSRPTRRLLPAGPSPPSSRTTARIASSQYDYPGDLL